jgi:molecular chaperone DnaJ
MRDIFGEFFGGDIFGDLFGSRSRRANTGPRQGANIRTSVRITFNEAVFGTEKELDLNLKDECSTCHGTGAKQGTSPETCQKCGGKGQVIYTQQTLFGMSQNIQTCPDCRGAGKIIKEKCSDCYGSGYITTRKKIQVVIPAGIDNGQSVRIRGKGEPGINGGPRGDLLVDIEVSRHPIFQRRDYDIYSTAPISYATAVLGGDVRISTVDGDVIYTVKPGTQTDTKVRLREKGVPTLRNKNIRGDHYVTLVVQVPTNLTAEQKELLRKFDEAMKGNNPDSFDNQENSKSKRKFWK